MYHPNFLYTHYQYFEESQESHKSNLEILMEDFNASQTHSYPNYLYNYQSQHFEESQEYQRSDLETLLDDYNATLTYPQPNLHYNHHAHYFEESHEPQNSTLDALMEEITATQHRIRLETMKIERFVETQNEMQIHFEEPQESYN